MADVSTMTDAPIKRKVGRPKIFTEEEQRDKVKAHYRAYYQRNTEQKKKM